MSEFRHEFTVKRSEWYRGKGDDDSALLKEDGSKCCVGFLCLNAGLPKKALFEVGSVEAVHMDLERLPKWLAERFVFDYDATDWALDVYKANDTPKLSGVEREAKLTALFAEKGIKVTFVD